MYKGQGRNQRKLMTCAYWEFLVHGEQLQAPIPTTKGVQRVTRPSREGKTHVEPFDLVDFLMSSNISFYFSSLDDLDKLDGIGY